MSVEEQKLNLIQKIAALKDAHLVFQLAQFLDRKAKPIPTPGLRRAGFAKGLFPYVSPDFDDSLPLGFDDYIQQSDSRSNSQ